MVAEFWTALVDGVVLCIPSDTFRISAAPAIATAVRNTQHLCGHMLACTDLYVFC